MRFFGKASGVARPQAGGEPLPLPAAMKRIDERLVALIDLSSTRARLKSAQMPPLGAKVSLLIDCVRAFGTVAWTGDGLYDVAFDGALARFEVEWLRRDAREARLSFRTLEDVLAGDRGYGGID